MSITCITSTQLAETLGVSTRGLAARAEAIGITPIRIGHRTYRYDQHQVDSVLTSLVGNPPQVATGRVNTDPLTGGRRRR